jgi:hypothetical protein
MTNGVILEIAIACDIPHDVILCINFVIIEASIINAGTFCDVPFHIL